MKRTVKNVLAATALVLGANSLMAASASTNWVNQLFKEKIGRAPFAEANQRAEQANTVYRESAAPALPNTWFEDFYRAKYGHASALEQARIRGEEANTVYRLEVTPGTVTPANTWRNDFWKAKFGRPFPIVSGK